MDPYAPVQGGDFHSPETSRLSRDSRSFSILLIGRDPSLQGSRADVLKHSGFDVQMASPKEALGQIAGGHNYPLVVFSHTLDPEEILELGKKIRQQNCSSKLLLILGPDSTPLDFSFFDGTLEGLDGPAALVREVRRLVSASTPA